MASVWRRSCRRITGSASSPRVFQSQLWLGTHWETIASLRGRHVLIGTGAGRSYRAGYIDAVRCRQAPAV